MDFDFLLKQLQNWTNKIPLIVLGSGASIPFGLPSMWALGEHLKHKIKLTDQEDIDQFELFKKTLDETNNLEETLLKIQVRPTLLNKIIIETWSLVNQNDHEAFQDVFLGKLDFPLKDMIDYLINSAPKKLSIVTTNYDRLAEYAASLSNTFICTGFSQNLIGHFSSNIHRQDFSKLKGYKGQVNIWKVHGSLDWYRDKNNIDYQLPLQNNIPKNFKPLIITPGLSKYYESQLEPFRTIFTEADNELENATGYLCIGYGFNDVHVQPKLINQIINGKPIVVITKELTQSTKTAIIEGGCKKYILLEEANKYDTRVYSSLFNGPEIIENRSFWSLKEFLKLIQP